MLRMLGMRVPPATDLQGLPPEALALIEQMQRHIEQQEQALLAHQQQLAEGQAQLERKDREIALRDAKLDKLEFEIARFKRWKFGARTEAMNAEQRRLFEETLAEDEAALSSCAPRVIAARPSPRPRRDAPVVSPCRRTCAGWSTTTSRRTPAARTRAAASR